MGGQGGIWRVAAVYYIDEQARPAVVVPPHAARGHPQTHACREARPARRLPRPPQRPNAHAPQAHRQVPQRKGLPQLPAHSHARHHRQTHSPLQAQAQTRSSHAAWETPEHEPADAGSVGREGGAGVFDLPGDAGAASADGVRPRVLLPVPGREPHLLQQLPQLPREHQGRRAHPLRTTAAPPRSPALAAYADRLRRFEEWRRQREVEVGGLRAGLQVDVRDTESIWCEGTVVEVEQGERGPVAVLVHFNRWNSIYNEVIELPSLRLAPHRHFSARTDIPRYNLTLDDNNLRGLVVTGPHRSPPPAPDPDDSSSSQPQPQPQPQPHQHPHPVNLLTMINLPGLAGFNWDWVRAWRPPEAQLQDNHIEAVESEPELDHPPFEEDEAEPDE